MVLSKVAQNSVVEKTLDGHLDCVHFVAIKHANHTSLTRPASTAPFFWLETVGS